MKPLCVDLYGGLGGWAEGFLSEGYEVIGFDIERHDYGTGTYPGELQIADVRSLHGSQFANAKVIVASPPCQEPSYRAMPWKRAKALNAIGPPVNFIELFNACFRIQREASEAAGRYIPMIVENVKGAQPWVGRARWHYGSYYLWGDVPALMPITLSRKTWLGSWDTTRKNYNPDHAWKVPGLNWSGSDKPGYVAKAFNDTAVHRLTGEKLPGNNSERRWEDRTVKRLRDAGIKLQGNKNGSWFGEYTPTGQGSRNTGSGSRARKAASAQIAKIPFPLSQYIAQCFKGSL